MKRNLRIYWIDIVKAVCMLSVYLCHSEVYSGGKVLIGYLVHPFYVNAFFFVSGYLFFKKNLNGNHNWGGYLERIKNVVFRLVIPTLLFSSVLFIPKMFFHASNLNLYQFIISVFGGISFWFTSAMAITQIALLSIIFLIRQKSVWKYVAISISIFFLGWYLNKIQIGSSPMDYFPWFYKTGLEYTLIMSLGGVYSYYEKKIDFIKKYGMIAALAIYTINLVREWNSETQLMFLGLGGKCNVEGFIGILCGISLVIALCKKMRPTKWLAYIGQNSIIFYFFSGVFPAAIGAITLKLFGNFYIVTLLVALISIVLGSVMVYVINKYLPFMTDLRKIKNIWTN